MGEICKRGPGRHGSVLRLGKVPLSKKLGQLQVEGERGAGEAVQRGGGRRQVGAEAPRKVQFQQQQKENRGRIQGLGSRLARSQKASMSTFEVVA